MFEREYRELSFVPRWPIARLLRRQSVAEHSYYVALYAYQICCLLGMGSVAAAACAATALFHDLEESFTSDTPGPVKRAMVSDKDKYYEWCSDMLAQRFEHNGKSMWWLAKDEAFDPILKVANLMDEVAHLSTELQMGNNAAMPMWQNSYDRLKIAVANLAKPHPLTYSKLVGLVDDFVVAHRDQQSIIPLNDTDIK